MSRTGMAPRFAICDTPARMEAGDDGWRRLCEAVRRAEPDLLLMSELPFGRWIASSGEPTPDLLIAYREAHAAGVERLGELGCPVVLSTRPALDEKGRSVNEAFFWTEERGAVPFHTKQFFPEEEGYWEVRWFRRGDLRFRAVPVPAGDRTVRVGALICTDVWFNEWARAYGRQAADLVVVPRATPPETVERWRTAVRMAALVSGCWVASANRAGADPDTGQSFGGAGWIFDPDGALVATTAPDAPVAVAELDLSRGLRAKREYPRYVKELPEASPES